MRRTIAVALAGSLAAWALCTAAACTHFSDAPAQGVDAGVDAGLEAAAEAAAAPLCPAAPEPAATACVGGCVTTNLFVGPIAYLSVARSGVLYSVGTSGGKNYVYTTPLMTKPPFPNLGTQLTHVIAGRPLDLDVDDRFAYVVTDAASLRLPLDGSPPFVVTPAAADGPGTFAVGDTAYFFGTSKRIEKRSKANDLPSATVELSAAARAIGVSGDDAYFIAKDASLGLYVVEGPVPSSQRLYGDAAHDPVALAVDPDFVYVADRAARQIVRLSRATATPTPEVIASVPGLFAGNALALSNGQLYFDCDTSGGGDAGGDAGAAIDNLALVRVGKCGDAPALLSTTFIATPRFSFDGASIYASNPSLDQSITAAR